MKTTKNFSTLALLAAAIVFTSCKIPLLSVGLGDKVDILPPGITIVPHDGVQNGAYICGQVTVNGKVSDDVEVASVTWMFADEARSAVSPTGTATLDAEKKNWSFELDTQDTAHAWDGEPKRADLIADGEKTFTITVTDGSGKTTETRMLLIFDNTPPSATFINPANGATIYGQVTLRGASSDNTSLIKVQVRIGMYPSRDDPDETYENGFTTITGSKYDWVRSFTAEAYKDISKATDNGDETWTLPIYVRVYDYAGNVSTNEPLSNPSDPLYPTKLKEKYGDALDNNEEKIPPFSLIIDSNLDKPTASIQTPHASSSLAGTVVASGACFDENPGIKKVKMRIMALDDSSAEIGYVSPDGYSEIADPGWVLGDTTVTGGIYWQASLNNNENLYHLCAPGAPLEGKGVHNGKLRLDVQPVDLGDTAGNIQSVTFTLDQTIPRLENPMITVNGVDKLAWDYLYVRGAITLKGTASDNSAVTSIKLSLDGGDSYGSELPGTPGTPIAISVPINTLTDPLIPAAIRTDKNGPISMVVKLQDDSLHFNNWTVILNLDNRYPDKNDYTGLANGHDPLNLHGNLASDYSQLMGTCADTGSVSGIDKVEVYLTRTSGPTEYVVDLTDGSLVAKEQALFGDPGALQDYTTDEDCRIVIDTWSGDPYKDLDQVGSDVKWWAKLDTLLVPDGDIDIHYVAWDKAGNAVHGEVPGFIKNHAPVISSVTVGTDLNDDDDVLDTGEQSPYNPSLPITARNDLLYIEINATETGHNTPFVYSVRNKFYETGTELADPATGVALIDISSGRFGGDGTGKVFTVKITDAVGIEVSEDVTVNIDNDDDEDPTIEVLPIAPPADLLDWNASPVAGHIEKLGLTQYDNVPTEDADVSGTVMVRGTAHDNLRIDEIWLSIDGGAGFRLAYWNGAGLSVEAAYTTVFHITDEDLTDDGHDIDWDFKWNTATSIAAVAKKDVVLAFTAKDHELVNTSSGPSGSRQYDVVPYITEIETAITGFISKDFARSALGRYPVRTGATSGETITVKGYNLNPTATGIGALSSDVRIESTTHRNDTTKSPGTGSRGLAYAGVASPFTSFTATISSIAADASIGSGYLVVWVNGVPSLNARSGRSNAETNFVSQTGTDERWLSVWARTVFKTDVAAAPLANHAVYPSMRMNGDTPVFAYVNNVFGYGLAEYWNGTNEWEIYENWDLFTFTALDLNSSGTHAALYDINVVRSGSINKPDDKGGILTTYFYQPPNTDWTSSSFWFRDYHIWLDNLWKDGVPAILGRYQYPDIDLSRDSTTAISKVFYSVYDSIDDKVLVRAFNVGTNSGSVGSTNKINNPGTNVYTNIAQQNQSGGWPTYLDSANDNGRFNTGSPGSNAGSSPPNAYTVDTGAGPWTAVAGTSGNVAVVAWYDTDTNSLKFAYNAAANVSGAGAFVGTQVLDTYCGGDFVDMVVDTNDHIHIAYHDSFSGDLMYAYLPAYNGALEGPYVVDSYLTVGNKASISVSTTGVPYITYKGMGNTAKAAWLVGMRGDGVDGSSKFNGTWEVQVLPTRIVDNDTNRFCIGVDATTLPVVGYTNDGIEYIRRLADLP
jgi:hypothetical protein